jgi:hypothetical protein
MRRIRDLQFPRPPIACLPHAGAACVQVPAGHVERPAASHGIAPDTARIVIDPDLTRWRAAIRRTGPRHNA